MSLAVDLQEQVEQISLELGLEPVEADEYHPTPEPVVQLSKAELKRQAQREHKLTNRPTLRVRDTWDEQGDLMFELSMLTYDRRAIDDLAERYKLNLVFITDVRDYCLDDD